MAFFAGCDCGWRKKNYCHGLQLDFIAGEWWSSLSWLFSATQCCWAVCGPTLTVPYPIRDAASPAFVSILTGDFITIRRRLPQVTANTGACLTNKYSRHLDRRQQIHWESHKVFGHQIMIFFSPKEKPEPYFLCSNSANSDRGKKKRDGISQTFSKGSANGASTNTCHISN